MDLIYSAFKDKSDIEKYQIIFGKEKISLGTNMMDPLKYLGNTFSDVYSIYAEQINLVNCSDDLAEEGHRKLNSSEEAKLLRALRGL